MVWDGGDMAAQYAEGIAVAVICLNLHAAQRVRVVAGPELGHIAQKAQIRPVTAGGTAFEKNVGELAN